MSAANGFVVGTILACLSSAHFYSSFENFIGVLLFFFVPWSAINLVDYYLVKHGRYDVQSFFKPDGIYGGFQWRACICCVITLAVQVPFLDQLFYVGPLVSPLGRCGRLLDRRLRRGIAAIPGGGEALRPHPAGGGGRGGCGVLRFMRRRG